MAHEGRRFGGRVAYIILFFLQEQKHRDIYFLKHTSIMSLNWWIWCSCTCSMCVCLMWGDGLFHNNWFWFFGWSRKTNREMMLFVQRILWSFKVPQSPCGRRKRIFIQTDYILNETSKIARTEKTQIGLQPNTSPAPMYVFANVHLLEFFVRDTNV